MEQDLFNTIEFAITYLKELFFRRGGGVNKPRTLLVMLQRIPAGVDTGDEMHGVEMTVAEIRRSAMEDGVIIVLWVKKHAGRRTSFINAMATFGAEEVAQLAFVHKHQQLSVREMLNANQNALRVKNDVLLVQQIGIMNVIMEDGIQHKKLVLVVSNV